MKEEGRRTKDEKDNQKVRKKLTLLFPVAQTLLSLFYPITMTAWRAILAAAARASRSSTTTQRTAAAGGACAAAVAAASAASAASLGHRAQGLSGAHRGFYAAAVCAAAAVSLGA